MWQLAWSQMNPLMPRWLAWVWAGAIWLWLWYLLDPTFIGWLIASSPRVVWEIANALWIGAKKIQSYVDNIKKMRWDNIIQPQWNIIKALPQETKSNLWTKKNPIVSRIKDVKVIEKWTAKQPWTTRIDPKAVVKQWENPVKTVPKITPTSKVDPKQWVTPNKVNSELQTITKQVKDKTSQQVDLTNKSDKGIIDTMNNLTEEAKKYKSADEFIDFVDRWERIDTNIDISKINKEFWIYKRDMQKAFDEIKSWVSRTISKEPIRSFYDINTWKYNVIDGYHRIADAVNKWQNKIKWTMEYEFSGWWTIKRDEILRKIREQANKPTTKVDTMKTTNPVQKGDLETRLGDLYIPNKWQSLIELLEKNKEFADRFKKTWEMIKSANKKSKYLYHTTKRWFGNKTWWSIHTK